MGVQASLAANTFAVTGHAENKQITEMLPGILNQLGAESLTHLKRLATTDDKKLQSSLKKLSVNNIPGIEEVNMIKDDGTVIHFNNPKVQASLAANTFAVTGHAENKQITEMLPGILNQ